MQADRHRDTRKLSQAIRADSQICGFTTKLTGAGKEPAEHEVSSQLRWREINSRATAWYAMEAAPKRSCSIIVRPKLGDSATRTERGM